MPKQSNIDIKSLGKKMQTTAQDIIDNVPSAVPAAPEQQQPLTQFVEVKSKKRIKINHKNVRSLYFDDEMWEQIQNVVFNNRVPLQRVVQAAIYDFFQRNYEEERLNERGMDAIHEYEKLIEL